MTRLSLSVRKEAWDLKKPVRIARQVYHAMDVVVAELTTADGMVGRGEAAGLPYEGETMDGLVDQLRSVEPLLGEHLRPDDLLRLLPRGGARNALDCALWDLQCKRAGKRIPELCGLHAFHPVRTALTFGIMTVDDLYAAVAEARHMPIIKLKVDRYNHIDHVRAAREAHPDARIVIDANGSWDRELLDNVVGPLNALNVELIEQPVAVGADDTLASYAGAIPLAADESCTDLASLSALQGIYSYVNIKLDKTGGLTEALALAKQAREDGFGLMVGNMGGTSLAMAAHFVIAQKCDYVDLDAPLLCRNDRSHALVYDGPMIQPPVPELWG